MINRGNARARVFHGEKDYIRFVRQFERARQSIPMRLVGWCIMPNHFHFILWPFDDGDLSRFMHRWMTAHVQAHRKMHATVGHFWQGRFKHHPIQEDGHLLAVMRYVERNPLRADLVARAEDWRWSSLSRSGPSLPLASPVARSDRWLDSVNGPEGEAERKAIRACVERGRPFGDASWTRVIADRLGLESSLDSRGRRHGSDARSTASDQGTRAT